MSLSTATLAELARKRAGVGPVRSTQTGSPYSSFPTAAPNADGDGVDTSSAVLANLIITATGGAATFALRGRGEGQAGTFEVLDGWESVEVAEDKSVKFRVPCETEDELHVQVLTGGTSVQVEIEPCNG